jgi:phosphoglycolate phosphatase-like HAD superfamily hydrolase
MMLQFDDDGTVNDVTEDIIYVYKNEFKELIDEYEQLKKENEQLKKTNNILSDFRGFIDIKQQGIKDEKQQKRFLKIHDDYYIQYGDDKELFDLHKPADIRSLCIIINREHGFSELQCEYNDKELE